ncbi:MAG: carboxypeptidase-like regulatory domain-containing protein [Pyrinomonadaceae bacterium]
MKNFKFSSLVAALVLCLASVTLGQETTGNIEGTISDPQGGVVPGVVVTVTTRGAATGARQDTTTGFNRTVTTDQSGFFRMQQVPPGFYTVSTSAISGFSGAAVNGVEVVLGKTTPVNISLQTGGLQETVTVTAETVAIDPTDNKIRGRVKSCGNIF